MIRIAKINETVAKETKFMIGCVVVLSVILQAVFFLIGKWDYTVLTGNILGATAITANFFLLCLAIQKSVGSEEKDIRKTMQLSHSGRFIMLLIVAIIGGACSWFNLWATVIPFCFTRIAMFIRGIMLKKEMSEKKGE